MKSHEINYKVIGHDIQYVDIELAPSKTVIADISAVMYMEDGIDFETKMGDGSDSQSGIFGKLVSAGTRSLAGKSAFITHFTNNSNDKRHIAFLSPYPGTIMPVNLATILGNSLIVQKDAFLCAAFGNSIIVDRSLSTGVFEKESLILEKLEGDGMAFLHATGNIIERQLNNETLRVNTGCIVGFEPQINCETQVSGSLKSAFINDEKDSYMAVLQGTGRIWLHNMPILKLIRTQSPKSDNEQKSKSFFDNLFE